MKNIRFYILFGLIVFTVPLRVAASPVPPLTITPLYIDEKANPGEIFRESLTLVNSTDRVVNIFPSVYLVPALGRATSSAISMVRSISLDRGALSFAPHETKHIDFSITITSKQEPGIYHLQLAFAEGTTRYEAESNPTGTVTLALNIELLEVIKERVVLKAFSSGKRFLVGAPARFSFLLENSGNRTIIPEGFIRVYGKRGEEVVALKVNAEEVSIDPNSSKKFQVEWHQIEKPAYYKVLLDLEYGAGTKALQDTLYFIYIPKKIVILVGGLFLILFLLMVMVIRRRHRDEA